VINPILCPKVARAQFDKSRANGNFMTESPEPLFVRRSGEGDSIRFVPNDGVGGATDSSKIGSMCETDCVLSHFNSSIAYDLTFDPSRCVDLWQSFRRLHFAFTIIKRRALSLATVLLTGVRPGCEPEHRNAKALPQNEVHPELLQEAKPFFPIHRKTCALLGQDREHMFLTNLAKRRG
jgi:hypothetical protein